MKKIMKKFFAVTALLLLALPAVAADSREDSYASVEDIPRPLARLFRNHDMRFEEKYIREALSVIRNSTLSKDAITQADVEREMSRLKISTRSSRAQEVMRYDRDFDGKVSLSEVLEGKQDESRNYGQDFDGNSREAAAMMKLQAESTIKRYDTDKDGIVTLKEAAEFGKAKARRRGPSMRQTQLEDALAALDPDKDGKLTAEEMAALAKKAFRTVDADGDGMLSQKELKSVMVLELEVQYADCPAPKPAKEDRVVMVSVDGGGMFSPLGNPDKNRNTPGVLRLDIEKGTTPLYIVANAATEAIWQVTGDTARVSRLLAYGPINYENGTIMAGVAGLPAAKVSFLKPQDADEGGGYQPCMPQNFSAIRRMNKQMKRAAGFPETPEAQEERALQRIIGRKADAAAGFAQPSGVAVGDGEPATGIAAGDQPAPDDVDAETWKDFIRLYPAGIAEIKKEDLVTEQDYQPRKILPSLAGVAQLVKSGHLVREKAPNDATVVLVTGGGQQPLAIRAVDRPTVMQDQTPGRQISLMDDHIYRVAKEIDEYPRSHGGYTVRYILPKDTEPPRDRQGCFMVDGEDETCR